MEKGRSSSAVNSGYAKKCKELERLEAQVSEAYAAFDAMGDNTSRTRSQRLKRPKSLSKLINELGKNFNKKVEEVEGLKEDMRLERREFAETLEATKSSYESSHEEALKRERAAGEDKLALQAFEQEAHIIQLSRQLKEAEEKLRFIPVSGTPLNGSLTVGTTSTPSQTPNVDPTPLHPPNVQVDPDPSPTSSPEADKTSSLPAAPSTTRPAPIDVVRYIDAADANDVIIYFRHLFTQNYLLSEDHTVPILGEPCVCRWPDEWSLKVEALKKYQREGWRDQLRMMNCMKMYGLSITKHGYLIVRDHRSIGPPAIFWKHNTRGKGLGQEKFEWKVQNGEADDAPGRYLKKAKPLDIEHGFEVPLYGHGLVTQQLEGYDACEVIRQCSEILGVHDHSSLIRAVRQYKDRDNMVTKVVKVTETLSNQLRQVEDTRTMQRELVEHLVSSDNVVSAIHNVVTNQVTPDIGSCHQTHRECSATTESRSKARPNKRQRNQRKNPPGNQTLVSRPSSSLVLPKRQRFITD